MKPVQYTNNEQFLEATKGKKITFVPEMFLSMGAVSYVIPEGIVGRSTILSPDYNLDGTIRSDQTNYRVGTRDWYYYEEGE